MKHLGTKTGGPHHVINSRRGASPFLHSVIGGELQYHSQTTINLSLSLCLFVYHFPQDSPRCLCPTVCGTTNCTSNCTKSCSNACVFFLRFVVHQIVQSVLLLFFYVCSENDKSTLKPKTSGFVLFSSSELGSGSGRSQASLQNLDRITKHVILAHRRFIYLILAIFIVLQMVPHFVPLLITKFRPYTTKINTY